MSNAPQPMNPVAQLGEAIAIHGVAHAYGTAPETLQIVGPALALGMAGAGLVCFRFTAIVNEWAFRYPLRYRWMHAPFIGPGTAVAAAVGVGLAAPGYLVGMTHFRPGSWPNWGTLAPETAFSLVGGASLALAMGSFVLLRRIGHDGKNYGIGRACARWAKWADVQCHTRWGWTIPMQVSYRGSQKNWKGTGAGKTAFAPSDKTRSRHVLLVGQTGSGKGYCVFGPIIASSKVPIVYQDVKGQCPGIDDLRKRLGVDPIRWGCAAQDGWPSMPWNPMEECRRDPRPEDAFNALAAALIPEREGNGTDWVSQLTRPILSWVFMKGGFETLGNVQEALMQMGVNEVIGRAGVPQGLIAALEGKNVKEYLGTTVFSALACFGSGWGKESTSGMDFTLDDVCTNGAYVLSAEPEVTQRAPIVVFWRLLLRKLLRSSKPVPLTLAFDEALAAGRIPSVRDALATLRDREVSIIFGTQHTSGLKEVYGNAEGESLIASFTSRIFLLNGLDPRDRDYLVDALGKRTVKDATVGGKGGQTRHIEVPLLTRDDLNRRASDEGAFWAVLDGSGVTRTGDPLIARLLGTPGKNLIRRPSQEEISGEVYKAENSDPQVAYVTPPLAEQLERVLETLQDGDMVALPHGEVLESVLAKHPELMSIWARTGKVPGLAFKEAMAIVKPRSVDPDSPSDDYLTPPYDEPLVDDQTPVVQPLDPDDYPAPDEVL